MAASRPPLSRDDWIFAFTTELARLRDVSSSGRFAQQLAGHEWVEHQRLDPVKAAQAWVKRQEQLRPKP